MIKHYRRHCKQCKKPLETVYVQQWTCGSPLCIAEYQRKQRLRNRAEYLVGGKYSCYRQKLKTIDKISTVEKVIKNRVCLGLLCRGEKEFVSDHKFNRICDACKVAMQNHRSSKT